MRVCLIAGLTAALKWTTYLGSYAEQNFLTYNIQRKAFFQR